MSGNSAQQRRPLRSVKASAKRSGARHSMPRRRASRGRYQGRTSPWNAACRSARAEARSCAPYGGIHRHVNVRLTEIAIPLRDLVFENGVIAERVPGQVADLAVILVRIVAPMREDQIGIRVAFSLRSSTSRPRPGRGKSRPGTGQARMGTCGARSRKAAAEALASLARAPGQR